MPRPRIRSGVLFSVAILAALAPIGQALAGGLTFVETEVATSTDGVAVSPDGKNLYTPRGLDELLVYTRNLATGELALLQTLEDGVGGVDAIERGSSVAVSPDGECVYVASDFRDTVAALDRNPLDGTLTFDSFEEHGVGGVTALVEPSAVVVSPDDLHVYVAARDNVMGSHRASVVAFSRTPPACGLTFIEAELGDAAGLDPSNPPDGLAITSDGKDLLVPGRYDDGDGIRGSLNVVGRNAITGALTFLHRSVDGLDAEDLASRVRAVALSSDGTSVYAVSSGANSIVAFARDTLTSELFFVDSYRDGGPIDGMKSPRAVVVSPDGAYVYVTSADDRAVVVFRRDPATSALRFLEVHKDPAIDPPNEVLAGTDLAVSPAGDSVYASGSRVVVFAVDACGNGTRGVDEQCDDGNVTGGDGCSTTCRLELCGALPTAGCRGTAPLAASLKIRNDVADKKDQLQWKWNKGDATLLADFGDPTTNASYLLCIYDGSAEPQPLLASAAPAGGVCRKGAPCWKAKSTSYQYKDGLLTPDGVFQVQLREGLTDGAAKIQLKSKGGNVLPPTGPLTLPVTVQMKNTATGACWEATYTSASTNDDVQFKAKGD